MDRAPPPCSPCDDEPQDLTKKPSPSQQNSLLRSQLEARPSGLSLLVAALDADLPSFRSNTAVVNCVDSPSPQAQCSPMSATSASDTSAASLPNPRRRPIPEGEKDAAYWEKRRRNNEAAKRSREKRRVNDMAMEARLLELSKENSHLKYKLQDPVVPPVSGCSSPLAAATPIVKPEPQAPIQGSLAAVMPRLAVSLSQPPNTAKVPPLPPNPAQPFVFGGLGSAPSAQPLLAPFVPSASPHLLQLYQYQAAVAAQQSRLGLLAATVRPTGAFQPFVPDQQQQTQHQQNSPDSTEQVVAQPKPNVVEPVVPSLGNLPFADGKQYLRYKLLERQHRRFECQPNDLTMKASPLLGSLLTTGRHSPPAAQQQQPEADSSEHGPTDPSGLSLKQCLSSLAVHLGSHEGSSGKSESSHSSDSLVSPASSQGTDSNASLQSQPSPPESAAILHALQNPSNTARKHRPEGERYTERRRRNNEAAKRCRANRRMLFEYRIKRAQELEHENSQLKDEMQKLGRELMLLKEQMSKQLSGRGAGLDMLSSPNSGGRQQHDSGIESQAASEEPGSPAEKRSGADL